MHNVRKEQLKNTKKGRQIIYLTISVLLFIYLTFIMIAGEKGFMSLIRLRSTRDKMTAENVIIKQQNDEMRARIESYDSTPEQYEGLAREYGMTREGELIFKFEDKE